MSDLNKLYSLIGQQINDPDNVEITTGAGSVMVDFINRVLDDTSKLTDCLQHKVEIKGDGTAESFALPTGGVSYIEVLDFAQLASDNTVITVVVDGTSSVKTEGVDWTAETTDIITATNLAAALTAISGITATSNGAVITVTADDTKTIDSLSSDSSATDLKIDNSSVWRIINVVDRTNNRIYLPISRRGYQAAYLSIQGLKVNVEYYYNVFGFDTNRDIHILPFVASNLVIDMDVSITHPKLVHVDGTERPLGLLNEYDALVIAGVSAIYYGTNNDETRGQFEFQKYLQQVKILANEVGTHPDILPEMSSIHPLVNRGEQQ